MTIEPVWILAAVGVSLLIASVLLLLGMRQLANIRALTNEGSFLIRALTRPLVMLRRLRRRA